MKVLQIVRSLDVGGLEVMVRNLAAGLAQSGVGCHLACLHGSGPLLKDSDFSSVWIGDLNHDGWLVTLQNLRRYARRIEMDVIHTHNPQPHLAGVVISRLTGAPIIHTKHGKNRPEIRRRVLLNRCLSRLSHQIAAVSESTADVARQIERVSAGKVHVIANGVDTRHFSPIDEENKRLVRQQLGIPQDSFVVGTVGRLSAEKNYASLIRCFHDARTRAGSSSPSLERPFLLIVGDGPERELLQTERDHAFPGHSLMPGMQTDVLPWIQSMDVFCLTSLTEGTPMTLLEAGACGLPCVVTDVGGNGEVVKDGTSGYVIPLGDEKRFADSLLDLWVNAERRLQFGLAARTRVCSLYSVTAMVEAYMMLYHQAVETG